MIHICAGVLLFYFRLTKRGARAISRYISNHRAEVVALTEELREKIEELEKVVNLVSDSDSD